MLAPLFCLIFLSASSPLWAHSTADKATPPTDVLSCKVAYVRVEKVSIVDALKWLKVVVPRPLVFSLEVVPFAQAPERNLTLELTDTTLRGALEAIVEADSRYSYEVVGSELVHVFPRRAREDSHDLLNVKVKHLTLSNVPYDGLFKFPDFYIPALQGEMSRYGPIIYSMMLDPRIPTVNLTFSDVTVREILNRVALETLKLTNPVFPPTGWIYKVHLDSSLPMGGRPEWGLFP